MDISYRGESPYSESTSDVRNPKVLLKQHLNGSYAPFPETKVNDRKSWILWGVMIVLLVAAVANLILSCILMGVLRLGYGMKHIEFIDDHGHSIKFYGDTDLDNIIKADGLLGSFKGEGLVIEGDGAPIQIKLADRNEKVEVNEDSIVVEGVDSFQIIDPNTGKKVFGTDYSQLVSEFGLPSGVRQLDVKQVNTDRIASPLKRPLHIKASNQIKMKGNEGTLFDGKDIIWTAGDDIYLKSVNGSIVLSGKEGIRLDVSKLGVSLEFQNTIDQHKLCVCMPSGKLFKVPVDKNKKLGCGNIDAERNPCK